MMNLLPVLLGACGASPEPPRPAPDAAGWYEFQGSWVATGSRHVMSLGMDRFASLLDLSGTLLLDGPSRLGQGFRGDAIALNDTTTGLTGRVVWTDERGDQVFSAIEGQGVATGRRITGTFIGGTGRYAGASGTYEFTWQYVLEAEDGTVQGRAVGLKGRVRVPTASTTSLKESAKP